MGQGRGRWDRKPVSTRHQDALSAIDWREFERLLADYYRDQGYDVQHDGTAGRGMAFDGGVDLRLRKDGRLTLVQCKHENAFQTEHNVVNELLGIRVNEGADAAIVITSGEFTAAARRFGSQGHVQLIDGIELRRMLGSRLPTLAPPAATPMRAAVERFAWEAVNHIASAPGSRRRSRAVEVSTSVIAFKAISGLVGLLLLIFVVPTVLPKLFVSLLVPPPHTTQARVESPPAVTPPVGSSQQIVAQRDDPSAFISSGAKQLDAKAQAKRDAEVQAYLNRVPELTHYRYSPLDQNRDPPSGHPTEP
jgi:hypothetical protein